VPAWTVAVLVLHACPAPAQPTGARGASEETWSYVVRPGDTLIGFGRAYLENPDEWRTVARLNRVSDPTRLRVGSALRVPLPLLRTFAGSAEILWTRGTVQVVAADGSARAASEGQRIPKGARIETGVQSGMRLRLVNGALLLIGERTRVSVDDLTVFDQAGVAKTRLGVGTGRIETQVAPSSGSGSKFEIRTPVVTTAVRGTDYRVSMDAAGEVAHVEVVSGRVAATADGTAAQSTLAGVRSGAPASSPAIAIDAGQALVATRDAPPTQRTMLVAPDLTGVPARVDRLPVHAAWGAAPDARAYRVRLFEAGGNRALLSDVVVDEREARWPTLDDGEYRLYVRAIDDAGIEGHEADTRLVVDARPEPPFASAPVNASRVYGERTEFRWTRSDSAASYDLQVALEPTFAAPLVNAVGQPGVNATHELQPGLYYWRVASRTAAGERGPFGDPLTFTQRRYPEGRTATAGVAADALTLRWSPGASGETARFQLAGDRAFDHVLVDRTLADAQVTVPRPAPGTYYLRVCALDSDGVAGPYGPVQAIDVPAAPDRRHSRWWWIVPPAAAAIVLLVLL